MMTAKPQVATPYELVPYRARPCPDSHPNRLAIVGRLLGLEPPPVATCRVLELACGDGSNLLAIADSLPGAKCLGIDLSPRHIDEGNAEAAALGLTNVTLRQGDVMDLEPGDAALGEFDYIIAHGFYSWVPRPVQDRLLALCRRHLAPQGVAFVSYNINPGWRVHSVLRDFMLLHTRGLQDPAARVQGAEAAIDLLAQGTEGSPNEMVKFLGSYARIFKEHLDALAEPRRESALLYDSLFEINSPVYFSQFANHAARHGLQYVAEADFQMATLDRFPSEVAERLAMAAGSQLDLEQYADFMRMKMFRQSVLCHGERSLSILLDPARLLDVSVGAMAKPGEPAAEGARFTAPSGATLVTNHPLTEAALLVLCEAWPQLVPFGDLVTAARARLGQPPLDAAHLRRELCADETTDPEVEAVAALGVSLLRSFAHGGGLVRLSMSAPELAATLEDRPTARPFARRQALTGDEVTGRHHDNFTLEPLSLALLPLLDGTRDREALLDGLRAKHPDATAEDVERHLRSLRSLALLVPSTL